MADPGVTKVLHGADYDVTTLKRDFGFSFAGVFDTMIAARFLGLPEIGLQAVARRELGVELSKASQKDDWSRRPLTPTQEAYALADVLHLLEIRAAARRPAAGGGPPGLGGGGVRGRGRARAGAPAQGQGRLSEGQGRAPPLPARPRHPARALRLARGPGGERTDTPAFKILGNETLLALAEAAPQHARRPRAAPPAEPLPRARRRPPGARSSGDRAYPDADLPRIPREPRPVVSDEAKARAARLKAWRAQEAEAQKLDPSVILPQRLIDRLAESPRATSGMLEGIEGLRRWRIEAFGPALAARDAGPLKPVS